MDIMRVFLVITALALTACEKPSSTASPESEAQSRQVATIGSRNRRYL